VAREQPPTGSPIWLVDNGAQTHHVWGMADKEAVVRARIDEKLKRDSETILRRLGISQTEAIRMFFSQVVLRQGLPFAVSLQNEDNDDLLLPRAKRQAAIDAVEEP
jgi:addiction module RelB/DinJ family antitoxin